MSPDPQGTEEPVATGVPHPSTVQGSPGAGSDGAAPAAGDTEDLHPPAEDTTSIPWKAVVKRAVAVVIAGVALYLVGPKLVADFASFPKLSTANYLWLAASLLAEVAHFACTFSLQRIALRTKAWFPVITAQLSGNSLSMVMPGGAAMGAALQFRMLAESGMDASEAVSGLTTFSLLGIAGLLALPVIALPVILFGSPISPGLANAAVLAGVAFALFMGFGATLLAANRPICVVGRVIQRVHNRLLRGRRAPITGLDERLVHQRDQIRTVLGKRWWEAVLLSAGRLALDLMTLVFALWAVGSHPRLSLVLIAYAMTGLIGLVPITPGGLGIVEASLTGFLVLAGVPSGAAVLATLIYRLDSYWVPMAAGPVAYRLFRHRYGRRSQAGPQPSAA